MTMRERRIAILAPRLPPQPCGVGAYAWQLYQHSRATHAAEFFVLDDAERSREMLPDTQITRIERRAASLRAVLHDHGVTDLILHYAARAYQRFGVPLWLQNAIAGWARDPAQRLHVIFHELPATDLPLLSKHGVANFLSRRVAKEIACCASGVVTNSAAHARRLSIWRGSAVQWVPVGSTIPAATDLHDAAHRAGHFVVFGLPFTRLQILQTFGSHLQRWKQSGRMQQLHLIGPDDLKFSRQAARILDSVVDRSSITDHGELAADEVARVLSDAELCLTNSTPDTWSKSSTLMACIANGCAAIVATDLGKDAPPFLLPTQVDHANTSSTRNCGTRAQAWFREHATWEIISERISQLIGWGAA